MLRNSIDADLTFSNRYCTHVDKGWSGLLLSIRPILPYVYDGNQLCEVVEYLGSWEFAGSAYHLGLTETCGFATTVKTMMRKNERVRE